MKAIRMHSRGGPELLVYEDAPTPRISRGEVLVKVHAAAITPTEFTWNSTFTDSNGKSRLPIIPSFEFSGEIEKVSPDVSDLSSGDAVYGLLDFWRDGAAAEYVVAKADGVAPKPKSLDHIRAASVPLSGLTAWQSLFDYGKVSKGNRVLIHGAGGGVGSFAVQLAHWRGAETIATCSQSKISLVRGLGADEIIDYSTERFDLKVKDVDVVLDTVGGKALERSWNVLRRGGVLVTIVGDAPEDTAGKFEVRAYSILVKPDRSELEQIASLIDSGVIHPVIEAVFPLSQALKAYEHGLLGHNRGKVVLKVVG